MLLLTLASDHLLLQALLTNFSAHLTFKAADLAIIVASLATMTAFLATLDASLVTLEGHHAFAEVFAPSRTLYSPLECPRIFPVF